MTEFAFNARRIRDRGYHRPLFQEGRRFVWRWMNRWSSLRRKVTSEVPRTVPPGTLRRESRQGRIHRSRSGTATYQLCRGRSRAKPPARPQGRSLSPRPATTLPPAPAPAAAKARPQTAPLAPSVAQDLGRKRHLWPTTVPGSPARNGQF